MSGGREYELLIFDWDGTLADSAAAIVATMQQAIRALELPPRSDRQIAELIGLGLNEALTALFPEFTAQDLDRLFAKYRESWLSRVSVGEAALFPGAEAALRDLHARGYRLAVATGKSRAGLDRSLAAEPALAACLSHSRCADETASKPDPLMLLELLHEAGVEPGRALMIGDTSYDVEMAQAAGVDALAVRCGVHDEARLRAAGACDLVDDVSAVGPWLRGRATGASGHR